MKERLLKITLKLVWLKKSLLDLRYLSVHDNTQIFVMQFVLSAVLSLEIKNENI